jgi:hypothetical protein
VGDQSDARTEEIIVSSYADDPRVVKVSDTRFELPSPQGWVVTWHPDQAEWRAVAENEDYTHPSFWPGKTADEAIYQIIGDPQ